MDSALFDDMQQNLATHGPTAAINRLCTLLRDRKDFHSLFYALLLKSRHELGVSPIPTGPSHELPKEVHEPYEEAIRSAGRLVGRLYLEESNIPHAWVYYRMIGEPQPVAEALDRISLQDVEDVQQLVDIAFHQGVHPRKGFDFILERFGLCNAITTISSQAQGLDAEVRQHCIRRLVRALYQELHERLAAEIVRKEGTAPAALTVQEIMAANPWLFEDEFYHVDISHLGAVVQLSVYLPPGQELNLARELCAYGQRLSPRFLYPGDPPFEDQYRDYGAYLDILAGVDVETNLTHFRAKAAKADPEQDGTRPAEVLVNLLLHLNRPDDALAVARKHLAGLGNQPLSCPGLPELCQRAQDYRTLAEVAREQKDPVHFLAGLLLANAGK